MLDIKKIEKESDFNESLNREMIVDFLHTHLDKFGDPKEQISKSIDYAFSDSEGKGGFLLAGYYEGKLAAALVMNNTGMQGYIPENILVYVAVDSQFRNKGLGKQIVKFAFDEADGAVKLHVEYDNPAKRLYERLGMTTKYAEMRYTK